MKLTYAIALLILVTIPFANAQNISVLSAEDKQPVPGAHVICKNINAQTEQVFLTDGNGNANITSFATSNTPFALTVSYLGFAKINDTLYTLHDQTYQLIPERTTLNEVVVTAQYAPGSPEKAVHKIKIIDRKKIDAMAAVNLRDVLTNELNVRLSQDNVLGSSMSLQGVSGQNVKILVDGVPLTGRLNGNIDISQINMNNVERIEIVEGPLSVNYGTDALGGTISIITKKTQQKSFSLTAESYYESIGQYNVTGKIGYKKNKEMISLSGGRNYFDGWRTVDNPFHIEKSRIADSLRYMNWKPKEQYFGTLYYGHYFKELKFGYTGDYFYEQVTNRGLPRLPYHETAFDDYYNTWRINNSVSLVGQLNKNYYLNLLAAYTDFKRIKNTYFKDLTTLDQVLSENSGDQDTSIFRNAMSRGSISTTKASAKLNYEVGYDINHETALGLRIKNTQQQIGDYALFATSEYKPTTNFVVRPGLRVIYNTGYKAPLVPSVNFKYSFPAKEQNNSTTALRFSYARGFRAPSLKELYFYFVDINHNITGNNNLKAEQSHNFNFSASFNKTKQQKSFKTELSMFYNYIENMISLALSTGTEYSYFNLDKFQTQGVQLQQEFAVEHFKFAVGASYIGRYNQFSANYNSEKFTYTPEGKCNLFYEWHEQKTTFAVFYKYTGKMPGYGIDANSNVYKTEIQDYHTADASISKQLFKNKLLLSIGAKNLFDVKNIAGVANGGAHSSAANSIAVAMGRTYFVKATINLQSKQ